MIDFNEALTNTPDSPPSKEVLYQEHQSLTEQKARLEHQKRKIFHLRLAVAFIVIGAALYTSSLIPEIMEVLMGRGIYWLVSFMIIVMAAVYGMMALLSQLTIINQAGDLPFDFINTALTNLEELSVRDSPDEHFQMKEWCKKDERINTYLTNLENLGRSPVMGEYLAMEEWINK